MPVVHVGGSEGVWGGMVRGEAVIDLHPCSPLARSFLKRNGETKTQILLKRELTAETKYLSNATFMLVLIQIIS